MNEKELKLNNRAVALLSGGLDSLLALKLMIEQGIEITALHFTSPFCTCGGRNSSCGSHAVASGNGLGVNVKVIFKGDDYMEVIKNPKYGYGSHMNPCLDCRLYTFKKAKEYMAEYGASFLITGEVLGQRPMSQRRDTINLIEREAGLKGLIVRPLSAKHFPLSLPEKQGIVDRGKLLDIYGRGRKPQIELASEKGIINYPCPSGGCLLTDPQFSQKVRDLFIHNQNVTLKDITLLKIGRHLRINEDLKVIVGKNEKENLYLKSMALSGNGYSSYIEPVDFAGPTVLLNGKYGEVEIKIAGEILVRYSKSTDSSSLTMRLFSKEGEFTLDFAGNASKQNIEKYNVIKGG